MRGLFKIHQALFPEAKEVLKAAAVFHDIGSIKGECGWMHNQIGARRIKKILRELNYSGTFIEKVSRIILQHGFYPNPKNRKRRCDASSVPS